MNNDLLIYTCLNILGSYSLNDSPKNLYEYTNEENDKNENKYDIIEYEKYIESYKEDLTCIKDVKDDRDIGFVILSNRESVSNHLKKTKFCQVLINRGYCGRTVCNFAHSMDEIVFPECAFRDDCRKKRLCTFKHPFETIDEYKDRIHFDIPVNISQSLHIIV